VAIGFQSGLGDQCMTEYRTTIEAYRTAATQEIATVSRSMIDSIDGQSSIWNSLKVAKVVLEVLAVFLGIYVGGFDWWTLIYIPLFVAIVEGGFELGVFFYLEQKRNTLREHRWQLLDRIILKPFQKRLESWPLTQGSDFERLKMIEQEMPGQVKRIAELVKNQPIKIGTEEEED
jgi:hypothetical protein